MSDTKRNQNRSSDRSSSTYRRRGRYDNEADTSAYRRERYAARNSSNSVRDRRKKDVEAQEEQSIRRRDSRGSHSAPAERKINPLVVGIAAAIVIVLLLVCVACNAASCGSSGNSGTDGQGGTDAQVTSAVDRYLPTPYIAASSGITLHSAVRADQLTEILIHNASYSYALELTTELTEATNDTVMANGGTGRVADEQPTGDNWLTGEFIRCYRSGNAGPTMSAIDCGGPVGGTVYAPVSGTVVKVADYDLYGNANYPDVQIHIQPEGREDLDVVLIHLTDPTVEVGDVVEGGVTPIASIRDVYAYIGDEMQLKLYTAEGDNGNHTHIQVNDATNPDYHGLD